MHELLEIVRREAHQVVAGRQAKGTLVVTGYNPKTHAVKGILVPSGVESGWIPISAAHAGNGYGVLVGPRVGDPEKLDGDVFDVEFDGGDPNTPVAKGKHFSAVDAPPEVQSGEMLMKHETGGSTLFKADGTIVTTHKSGGTQTWDKDGNLTIDNGSRPVNVKGTISFNG